MNVPSHSISVYNCMLSCGGVYIGIYTYIYFINQKNMSNFKEKKQDDHSLFGRITLPLYLNPERTQTNTSKCWCKKNKITG